MTEPTGIKRVRRRRHIYHPVVVLANRRIRLKFKSFVYVNYSNTTLVIYKICIIKYLVFRSWSLIFFSISASVSVSKNGAHTSESEPWRKGFSTVDKGVSAYAYVLWCHDNWPRIEYAIAVTNSPPSPNSAQSRTANFSGLFSFSLMSHSIWSFREVFPTWIFNCFKFIWCKI